MTQPPDPSPPAISNDARLHRVEMFISTLLRAGVAASVVLIAIGSMVSFVRHPAYATSPAAMADFLRPGAGPSHSLSDVVVGLRDLRGQAIVTLGLLVLIATPIMRVAVSIVAFLLEGDRLYTLITLTVFCLLMLALVLGAVE